MTLKVHIKARHLTIPQRACHPLNPQYVVTKLLLLLPPGGGGGGGDHAYATKYAVLLFDQVI